MVLPLSRQSCAEFEHAVKAWARGDDRFWRKAAIGNLGQVG
jgi:hypothetical protein